MSSEGVPEEVNAEAGISGLHGLSGLQGLSGLLGVSGLLGISGLLGLSGLLGCSVFTSTTGSFVSFFWVTVFPLPKPFTFDFFFLPT